MTGQRSEGTIRGTLSPDSIAATALALGDQEGPGAMTVRRIAAHVGCDPMSLYRHFANRVALLDGVADLALAEVVLPDEQAPWTEQLRDTLIATRSVALAHPGIAPHVASRPPLGPHGRRIGQVLLSALQGSGLSDRDVVAASQVLVAYLSSSIAMAVATEGQRDDRWAEAADAVGAVSSSDLPADQMPAAGSHEQFSFGLDLLVDGLQSRAGTRPHGEV